MVNKSRFLLVRWVHSYRVYPQKALNLALALIIGIAATGCGFFGKVSHESKCMRGHCGGEGDQQPMQFDGDLSLHFNVSLDKYPDCNAFRDENFNRLREEQKAYQAYLNMMREVRRTSSPSRISV